MKQTRRHSFIESCTNVLIGYFVALASQLVRERTQDGKLSKNQGRMGPLTMEALGWVTRVAFGFDDAINYLAWLGYGRRR